MILPLPGQDWHTAQLGTWSVTAQQEVATPKQVVQSWYKLAGYELMVQVFLLELLTINQIKCRVSGKKDQSNAMSN